MTKVMGVGQMETGLPLISSLLFRWGDWSHHCPRVGGVRQWALQCLLTHLSTEEEIGLDAGCSSVNSF